MIAAPLLPPATVWLGVGIQVAVSISYVHAIAAGRAAPSRVTWGVRAVTVGAAAAAAVMAGASWAAAGVALATTAIASSVWVATWIPRWRGIAVARPIEPRYRRATDRACLAGAVVTGAAWWLTADPTVAVVLACSVNAIAAVPTFDRAWTGEELARPYLANLPATLITMGTFTATASTAVWLYPVYLTTISCLILLVIAIGRARQGSDPAVMPQLRVHPPAGTPALRAPLPDESDAVAFASMFAAEYLSWDERDPKARGVRLARFLSADWTVDQLSRMGWSGVGIQRTELVIPGRREWLNDSSLSVEVRLRIRPLPGQDAGSSGSRPSGSAVPATAAASAGQGSPGPHWTRVRVAVARRAGHLVIADLTAPAAAPRAPLSTASGSGPNTAGAERSGHRCAQAAPSPA